MQKKNEFEPRERFAGDIAIKHDRLLVIVEQERFIDPVSEEKVDDSKHIKDWHAARVHEDNS